jgi:hypothetical protein
MKSQSANFFEVANLALTGLNYLRSTLPLCPLSLAVFGTENLYRVIQSCSTTLKEIVSEITWNRKYHKFFFRFATFPSYDVLTLTSLYVILVV